MDVSNIKALIDKAMTSSPNDKSIAKAQTLIPEAAANEAVIVQINTGNFTLAKLENHLKDDAKGQGYKSKEGYGYTQKREKEALGTLADDDVSGFIQATSFLSGQTSYGIRVRAVEGIRQAAITSNQLRKLALELKNLKK
jgi:hypothetical protein